LPCCPDEVLHSARDCSKILPPEQKDPTVRARRKLLALQKLHQTFQLALKSEEDGCACQVQSLGLNLEKCDCEEGANDGGSITV